MSYRPRSPQRHDRNTDERDVSSGRSARFPNEREPHGRYRQNDLDQQRDRGYDSRRRDQDGGSKSYRSRDRDRDDDRGDSRDGRRHDRRDFRGEDKGRAGKDEDNAGRRQERDRPGPSRRSASPPSRSSRPQTRPASQSASRSASPEVDKAKPNFAPSGLLAAATNTVKAVDGTSSVLKYNEPPEARKPVLGWRLYVFKGSEQVELLHIHRQSAYLIGRDRLVADIPVDHPSCSKQHAVIQYRYVKENDEFGVSKSMVKPFIIDLESTNGTHVNDERIPVSRFYELKASDVIKFGSSTREYVLLHDESA